VSAPRRAAFLDRDGTLNVKAPEGEYISSPTDLRLLPGAADAVRRLNDAAMFVVVVTNQRGIARGLLSPDSHAQIMERLRYLLAQRGAHIDAVYVCPHEAGTCGCRKPAPGLLLRAESEHPDIDLGQSVTVGDAESDIDAGRGAGTHTVRLSATPVLSQADHVVRDLRAAVPLIFGALSGTNTQSPGVLAWTEVAAGVLAVARKAGRR
jgi:D-glycero-D-manno-heptose 1,7-bisphosphate phosphatase